MSDDDRTTHSEIILASSGARRVRRGIESWAIRLARDLNQRNLPATLYVGGPPAAPYERRVPSIGRDHPFLQRFRGTRWWYRRIRLEAWTFALGLVRHLSGRPRVVHVGDGFLAKALLRLRRLGQWRGRLILSGQTLIPDPLVQDVDFVQALTPDAEERFRSIRGSSTGVVLIPNYVDPAEFDGENGVTRRRLKIPDGHFVVLSVGAVARPYKRMDSVIEAFGRVRSGSETLVIAGAREESSSEIEHLAAAFGPAVRILYDLPPASMPQVYAAADCFVLASVRETFGIAFLEAMASRRPVIAHDWPATRWIVGPGGRLVDAGSPERMAEAIRELCGDAGERERLGRAGRQRVCERFSGDVVLPELLSLYRGALDDLS